MKLLAYSILIISAALASFYGVEASAIGGRVIGGQQANIIDYPYQASVIYHNSFRCGATIIARTWVLTSTLCLTGLSNPVFQVRVGTSFRELGGQVLNVSRYITHPDFNSDNNDYNIALVQLSAPIALSSSARISRLANNKETIYSVNQANLTGWGSIYENGTLQPILRAVELPVMSREFCEASFNYTTYSISDTMFCAGLGDGQQSACDGDDGGPLVSNNVLVGVVSWGLSCGRFHPWVFTDVGALRDWITQETGI